MISVDGLSFKDLDKDNELDAYEDWRKPDEERVSDLLGKMTLEEKAAQMVHITLVSPKDEWFKNNNIGFALVYRYFEASPKDAAIGANRLQELSEASRLGIPIILSMDSVNGASWVKGATIFPDQMGLGAAGDVSLVKRVAEAQREEMMAMGIRMSMSPIADLATDPRWARVQECFGEDAEMASRMVAAAIVGLQAGNSINEGSVLACVKHFPGSGPQTGGKDGSPLVFDKDSFVYHLSVFEAAIEAGAGSIMPYGYSKVPFLGGDAIDKPAHESHVVMTDLLRVKLGYEGIIQTDWGMKHVDAIIAGADAVGGAGQREITRIVAGVPAAELDDHVRRILLVKFKMGLFENPYVDSEMASKLVGSEANKAVALEAAERSLTLLKADDIPELDGKRLLVAGILADDADALSSGWKAAGSPGNSILAALQKRLGISMTTYIGGDVSKIGSAVPGSNVAVVVVGEKAGTHEPEWGYKTLEFPEAQLNLIRELHKAGIPMITVVLLGRPYVMEEVVELSDAVIIAYRPGVTMGAEAITEALLGKSEIGGKLPVQIPKSMEQVIAQREDLPADIPEPLFEIGFGLQIKALGMK